MPKTRINCPNCRQPITAEIDQLFDLNVDPAAKQRLLSGSYNLAQCPHCGYQGNLATPIVYHDPGKELLLTFVPPAVGLPRDEQERLIGSLINQVINKLPQEKRKAYLLRPQSTLTMQGMVERILEADGITREMIQAQQQRVQLIQRMMTASPDVLAEIAKQEDRLIDAEFFGLLRRLVESAMMGGDEESAQQLSQLQENLLPITTFGREMQAQSQEVEAAVRDLQKIGRELTRDKLLDLVSQAENDTRLRALVSLARPAMDYQFFQLLSERIERARGDGRNRLAQLREKLLELTNEVDRQMEARSKEAKRVIDAILQTEDPGQALMQNLHVVDDFFLHELNAAMEAAQGSGDLEKIGKLQKMAAVLQQLSSAPPEMALIEELLEAEDDQTRRSLLEEHADEITPEFLSALGNIAAQVQESDDAELIKRVADLNRLAMRFSMEQNLKK